MRLQELLGKAAVLRSPRIARLCSSAETERLVAARGDGCGRRYLVRDEWLRTRTRRMGNVKACRANGSVMDPGATGWQICTFRMVAPVRFPLSC